MGATLCMDRAPRAPESSQAALRLDVRGVVSLRVGRRINKLFAVDANDAHRKYDLFKDSWCLAVVYFFSLTALRSWGGFMVRTAAIINWPFV